ncbi:DUF421 domain-containing protein [Rubripirellula reticaptiva]|uniref:YetF C-terminal domain-containing protein n=1 Tax=Rubripirellula reticaptiva TaxID=2528013 RepID=A0A5C6EQQ4_9BACT|nr:YetF domain-containing protein [Rubripirellula reticaptiva]TWU51258.1 hypothetical protein Poly59_28500 [Rubripirellula reticaptiva]
MFDKWISASLSQLAMILLSSIVVYIGILLYTRFVGLRSFSKMSAADFAMTISVGSLFGATISSPSPTLFMGLFAIACMFGGQWLLAILRVQSSKFSKAIDNQPLLLMAGAEILHDNLRRANMTEHDLFGKLREANAMNFDQVKAVVFETTGDVSVLHADGPIQLESRFFESVDGSEILFDQTP